VVKNNLKEYKRKRDFSKTKEPAGRIKKTKPYKKLSFVIHEHHARRLHWDLRLEIEGVLKSWAVPKGPSLDPSDKRLAIQTEDHPIEYMTFKGEIPQGEYGAGEVLIWDKGWWEPLNEENPVVAIKKGHLRFRMHGKKLKGDFVLLQMPSINDERNKNWLLIKHRDNKDKKNSVKKKLVISPTKV